MSKGRIASTISNCENCGSHKIRIVQSDSKINYYTCHVCLNGGLADLQSTENSDPNSLGPMQDLEYEDDRKQDLQITDTKRINPSHHTFYFKKVKSMIDTWIYVIAGTNMQPEQFEDFKKYGFTLIEQVVNEK